MPGHKHTSSKKLHAAQAPQPSEASTPQPSAPSAVQPSSVLAAPIQFKADNFSLGRPDFGAPSAKYSEYLVIMMRAHEDLGINPPAGIYPKLETAMDYFKKQRLSNGALISPREAEKLASFCRPVSAKKGGNKKAMPKG